MEATLGEYRTFGKCSEICWVKAYITKNKNHMTKHERYVTVGNDKADAFAKTGAHANSVVFAEIIAKNANNHLFI